MELNIPTQINESEVIDYMTANYEDDEIVRFVEKVVDDIGEPDLINDLLYMLDEKRDV